MLRRDLVKITAGVTLAGLMGARARAQPAYLPPPARKPTYKVGFAQSESNNQWRIAETNSMQAEAKKRGWQLVYTDAASSAAKQVSDVNSMIAQGVDLIFLVPREERPLIPAVRAAKAAGIPVILIDRSVDPALAKPGVDFVTFIGSDFVAEGKRAGEAMVKATGGKGVILEIEGSTGSSPANDRKKGFDEALKSHPGMVILASQSGDFVRDTGRQVTQTLLQAHPDATVIYAHNDEMALGALTAAQAAGKVPGKDIIICSIDGEKDAVQGVIDGKIGAICQCSPDFGPAAFATAAQYFAGEAVPPRITNKDQFYDKASAAGLLGTAF